MLFNSIPFLAVFLPLTFLGFFLFAAWSQRLAVAWLILASLAFYGWNNPSLLLPLICSSIVFNFIVGRYLIAKRSYPILIAGISGNLLLLGVFKYAGFIVTTINALTPLALQIPRLQLPIGISFYTFTQTAFLVDAYNSQAKEYRPVHYGLFVTFFPHLIAGPILHHKEMMPQFERAETYRLNTNHIALGLTWFTIGLFKKVVIADCIAPHVNVVFDALARGQPLGFIDSWAGSISFALQLYFDFSGYSDMAIGLAAMFGIKFPLNFNSPYKAVSMIDFWHRWHITLSRLLREYLYIPLGGNRKGNTRKYANLLLTMTLGGLWHGASWNFLLWGGIHGVALAINHLWHMVKLEIPTAFARILTVVVVVLAWVPFRTMTFGQTLSCWEGMFGLNGIGTTSLSTISPLLLILSAGVFTLPNTQELIGSTSQRFRPTATWGFGTAVVLIICLAMMQSSSPFLYYQF